MVKVVIVAHGELAKSFRDTVGMIAGPETAAQIACLCMTPEKGPEEFAEEARELLNQEPDADYLIFADLFGASPCNTCISVFRNASYRLVTGVNLGALLEIMFQKDNLSLEELYKTAQDVAKEGVKGVYLHV
ncbi:PTS sugar transporter subunit IIA [Anaerosacchariphilus sp. NSJ-68]|uniref:PTS sugar transporter subunit IIA n=2 Tax=Lachnospiraceae TaxID=186803 RepID=A0A923LB22_9FIRM|nr:MULTISPECIES: PTS sugar transporter subunit IIA [Lachnospiraceae]MBC5659224.1 PTS sugar transporter subunit IIA [Anaerosacchariphilus hominis]MBC5696890.1 PTS sugar transporter subunit IIA [Roseburia difficilis]